MTALTDNDVVKWVHIVFAGGGLAVMFARGLAHWVEWPPWGMRAVGLAAVLVALGMTWNTLGPATMLKAALVAGVILVVYIWFDLKAEQADEQRELEQQEKLLK